MLGEGKVTATIAVSDIAKGKEFYGGTLELKQVDENPGGVTYECGGGTSIFVYPSQYAGSNQATCASWTVSDVAAVVADLEGKGVNFEQYDDLPGTTRDGNLHKMDAETAAWFKDPDGNILAISSM
jgi:catechol 2,3-dioxygenase-like lactoylglutathione lyase family enzyme